MNPDNSKAEQALEARMDEWEKNRLSFQVKEWAERTSIHALPNIASNDNKIVKVIWVLFLIVFTGLNIYFVSSTVLEFFEFKTDTLIVLEREAEFEFPTITFCNLQICGFNDYDFAKYLDKYKQEEQNKFGTSQNDIIDKKLREDNTKTSFFLAKEIFLRQHPDDDLNNILNKNATSINKMLISCTFGGEDCDENDFEFELMGEFHKCYKFNSGKLYNDTTKKSVMSKSNNGLHVELYVGSQSECKSPLVSTSGLMIYINNKTYTITDDDNSIQVEPGTHADISIDPTFVKKLPKPYSDCFDASSLSNSSNMNDQERQESKMRREKLMNSLTPEFDLINETIQLTHTYTQQFCLQLCYQKFLIRFCDCYDHTLPKFSPAGYSPCPKFIDSLYNCQYLIKRLFYNGKNDEKCIKKCPVQCDFTTYNIAVSSSAFPSATYMEVLREMKKNRHLENLTATVDLLEPSSVLSFSVFYGSNTFTRITEKPRSIYILIELVFDV